MIVENLRTRLSSYYLFFLFILPLPPLSQEGYPCTHFSPIMSEPIESSLRRRPASLSPCMVHPSLTKLVENDSFSGKSHENPYFHVRYFEQLCSTQGKTRATQDVLRRNLFPFSLSGGARTWYCFFGHDHLNWGALRAAFCTRFFPLRRIISLRMTILNFQ
jgi:hypothetical protein